MHAHTSHTWYLIFCFRITCRSYSTLSIASSLSSLASDLRDASVPSPLPTEASQQDHQAPSSVYVQENIPEISVQSPTKVENDISEESREQTINNDHVDNSVNTEVNEDGFILVKSDSSPSSNEASQLNEDSLKLTTEESDVKSVPESQSSTLGTTPLINKDAEDVLLQETTRIGNKSPTEKKDRFSIFKGNNKSNEKSKVSRKIGRKDKRKNEHSRSDEKLIDDTQSEISYQPDIDLSSKPQISKKARSKFMLLTKSL